MDWATPGWDEVQMDAEIGSYQEDTEPVRAAAVADWSNPERDAASDVSGATSCCRPPRSLGRWPPV
jgi:hypothetical protein